MSDAPLQIDAAGRLQQDLPCVRCGYNLRGQFQYGNCPECETRVKRSLSGSLLRVAAPWWVSGLATGMLIIAVWVSVMMLCQSIELLLFDRLTENMVPGIDDAAIASVYRKTQLMRIIPAFLGFFGVWQLTAADPIAINTTPRERQTVRLLARYAMAGTFALLLLQVCVTFLYALTSEWIAGLQLVMLIVGTVGLFMLFEYARRLALRLPNHQLARQTRLVMFGVIILWYLTAPVAIGHAALAAIGIIQPLTISPHWGISIAIAGLLFGTWAIVLAVWYRHDFNQAAIASEKTWDADRADISQRPTQHDHA